MLKRALLSICILSVFLALFIGGSKNSVGEYINKSGIDSLDHKIGQMLMVGFRGLKVSEADQIYWDIRDRKLSGVVLFDIDVPSKSKTRNIRSPKQLKQLTKKLQSWSETPLFISIDQEGGRVNRLKSKYGFPSSKSAQELGDLDKIETTRSAGRKIGSTLSKHGLNMNYAPVVDVNTNPDNPIIAGLERSFSGNPDKVTKHAKAFLEGQAEDGVIGVLKHYPGHGSSKGDTHLGMADVTDTWQNLELEPYRTLIKEESVDVIMTAHIVNRKLEPSGRPATLSRTIIKGILRDSLGFEGVVVSDDMQMGAIREHFGFKEAIKLALEADVDILIYGNNSIYDEDVSLKALSIIRRMVIEGEIPESKIEESYQRIMRLKNRTL